MIKNTSKNEIIESSISYHDYLAPEVQNNDKFSFPADIYSIGQIIYVMFENEFKKMKLDQENEANDYSKLYEIYKNCTKKTPSERPQINELI